MRTVACLSLFAFLSASLIAKAHQAPQSKPSAPDADTRKPEIQGGDLIKKVPPVYPKKARKAGVEGTVELHVVIAKNGSILSAEVISGHPLLVDAALQAVRRWRYEPSYADGQPVEIDTTISVTFTLNKNP